ncbi:MAG: c-type cytochrome, partial [Isosphaeraceae bacterium]|nr:c-type cytochrome [Isosphaeraceae bacterium]
EAVERGRIALTQRCFLPPAWSLDAYKRARPFLGSEAPDPDEDPEGYAAAFNRRYGLHPAPYPNDGLPMGLRRATSSDGQKVGIQLDCMVCHGGSIGGQSYVGLGNTQLDLQSLLSDLTRADGRILPPPPYVLNTARGTVNAGQIAVMLFNFRNPDLSFRLVPLRTGANLPEIDTPAWWLLKKKATMYYDGRTDARSARSLMQFYLGDFTLQQFKDLEPTYKDVLAYLKSLEAPKYPFPIDPVKAERGHAIFNKTCAKCHGTYGSDGSYPNEIVSLDLIGTDPARAQGITDRFVAHVNATWFAEEYPVDEVLIGYQAPPLDGVWATAPYLHNGSVPTLYHLLKSSERPARFLRPPSTDFAHYDTEKVGWKFQVVTEPPDPKQPVFEARFLYDTSRWGLSHKGHTFGDKLSEEERMDVIEYLKTL